jgi:hypothetical protein
MLEFLAQTSTPLPLEPVVPHIRSSDAKYNDDFLFLLKRRYGLVKARDYSEPLALGTHFHKLFEVEGTPNWIEAWGRHRDRFLAETGSPLQAEKDLDFAFHVWTGALKDCTIDDRGRTLARYLEDGQPYDVAAELKVSVGYSEAVLTAQIDKLRYDPKTNQVTLLDLKSTSQPSQVRAAMCPFEFQTWHYIFIVECAIKKGSLEPYGIPKDATVSGMSHIIFEKATIRPSGEDRDYNLKEVTPTRGKNAGTTRLERDYYGEPRWENFVERVKLWYKDHPDALLISHTHASANSSLRSDYFQRLFPLITRTQKTPSPLYHARTESGVVDWKSVSAYYPFYVNPDTAQWPMIAAKNGFKIEHRDEPLKLEEGQVVVSHD